MTLTLIGRSSSHFTRAARMVALELGVELQFQPVFDMSTLERFEVSLYCLVRHLEFRKLFDTSPFEHLAALAQTLDERESARATTYRFDAPA